MIAEGSSQELISNDTRQAILWEAAAAEDVAGGQWVPFFRDVFGRDGAVRRHLNPMLLDSYRQTPEFAELHERIADMRSREPKASRCEPLRMITIRLPASVHDFLVDESIASEMSMNQLCITKLLVPADPRFLPEYSGKKRGRKFGPQKPLPNHRLEPSKDADHGQDQTG